MKNRFNVLQPGEPIGVVALSGPIKADRLDIGLEHLKSWRRPLIVAPNLRQRHGYLAGTDSERLAGLLWVLDRGARLVIAARGGYGVSRVLADLPWQRLVEQQICFVGFSDLCALLNPLVASAGAVQVHGPMVAAGLHRASERRRLLRLLQGELEGNVLFRFSSQAVVRHGTVSGVSMGGNLTILASLIGTPHEPDLTGGVLFFEEVNEPLYRIDRKLTQLRCSGRLKHVKALIGGTLRGCRPIPDRTMAWRRLLAEAAPPSAAVVVGLPFGHGAGNMAFPLGVEVEVDTHTGTVTWRR